MAFRGLEPSTLEAFAAFTRVSRATRDRSAPRNGLATQTPITCRSSNEHDGGLRVGNEKQGTARFDLNLRAEQEVCGVALRIHVRRRGREPPLLRRIGALSNSRPRVKLIQALSPGREDGEGVDFLHRGASGCLPGSVECPRWPTLLPGPQQGGAIPDTAEAWHARSRECRQGALGTGERPRFDRDRRHSGSGVRRRFRTRPSAEPPSPRRSGRRRHGRGESRPS